MVKIWNSILIANPFCSISKDQANKAENKSTQSDDGIMSIQNYLVPLPPLSKQHRIVAKVDELFGICDALKEKIEAALIVQLHLADALTSAAV